MNWDRIEGTWKQVTGKAKEEWGKLTDDDLDVIAGRRGQLAGKLQERCSGAWATSSSNSMIAPSRRGQPMKLTASRAMPRCRSRCRSDLDRACDQVQDVGLTVAEAKVILGQIQQTLVREATRALSGQAQGLPALWAAWNDQGLSPSSLSNGLWGRPPAQRADFAVDARKPQEPRSVR